VTGTGPLALRRGSRIGYSLHKDQLSVIEGYYHTQPAFPLCLIAIPSSTSSPCDCPIIRLVTGDESSHPLPGAWATALRCRWLFGSLTLCLKGKGARLAPQDQPPCLGQSHDGCYSG